jgi:hypothetical protein
MDRFHEAAHSFALADLLYKMAAPAAPPAPSTPGSLDEADTLVMLNRYIDRKAQAPSPEMQAKRRRLLSVLSKDHPTKPPKA